MKNWRSIGSGVVVLLMIAGLFRDANAAPIDDLIAGARKEGVIELYAPSTLTPQGAQRLGEAFNKQKLAGSPRPEMEGWPPAQEILQKFGGQTSAFVPGTPAYKFAQTRNVIYMKQEHAEMVDRLTSEYGKIFGFQR
jgi:hypothetical protein